MKDRNYLFVIIGLMLIIGVMGYLLLDSRVRSSAMQEHYDNLIKEKEADIDRIRATIADFAVIDSTYYDSLQILKKELDGMEASRSWWFRQHQAVLDSIDRLTVSQLQEYFTERYP